jgi:hypothetical protein
MMEELDTRREVGMHPDFAGLAAGAGPIVRRDTE